MGELLGLRPNVTPTTEIVTSRDSAHLAALMRVLGLRAVLDDATTCTVVGADKCRLAAHPGIVVFGPAWVSGERAEMSAGFWARITLRRDGLETLGMSGGGVIVRCARTAGGGWQIVQVNRIHVQGS